MPELPEVERTRLTIASHVVGAKVLSVELRRRDICESFDAAGKPRKTQDQDLLAGTTIAGTLRHGKQMVLVAADDRALCIHLGMSGQVIYRPQGQPLPKTDHVHALWRIRSKAGEGVLAFRDPRRFGGLWTFPSTTALRIARWNTLGPDALNISAQDLASGLAGSKRAIKAALLDQQVLAGVGNIYADEALFAARIHPARRADKLTPDQIARLTDAICTILRRAIDAGGSTLRDYVDSNGDVGSAQTLHQVYARAGQSCLRCGQTLKGSILAQRATVHCPSCQPRGLPRNR